MTSKKRKEGLEVLMTESSVYDPSVSRCSSKGQMFIVAAVLILVGMVLLFNMVGTPAINEEKKFQETRLLSRNLENIINEMKFAAGLATLSSTPNTTAYFSQFSSYIRDETDGRILYVSVFFNSTAQQYSVEVGNYLGQSVNTTINVTNSVPSGSNVLLQDGTSATKSFSSSGPVNITLTYKDGSADVEERVQIPSGNNFALGFFDVTLQDGDYTVRSKDTYNRTW